MIGSLENSRFGAVGISTSLSDLKKVKIERKIDENQLIESRIIIITHTNLNISLLARNSSEYDELGGLRIGSYASKSYLVDALDEDAIGIDAGVVVDTAAPELRGPRPDCTRSRYCAARKSSMNTSDAVFGTIELLRRRLPYKWLSNVSRKSVDGGTGSPNKL